MHAPPPASPVPVVDSVADSVETRFVATLPIIRAVIRAVCHRYRVQPSDRDDFASSVVIKLMDDDYAVFRRFRGDSSNLRSFLWSVIARHLLDVRVREWGKWRPSRCARRLGSAAVYLEDLVYRQQTPVREAVAMVSHHPRWTLSTTKVRGLYAQLPTRVPRRRSESLDDAHEQAAQQHVGHAPRHDALPILVVSYLPDF